ncbi:MAG: CoA pyrophosphatase, partial [Chryseolinea sp.]
MKLEKVVGYLQERLSRPLPAGAAHELMRATAVGNVRPKFDHTNPPRTGSVLVLLYQDGNDIRFPLIRRQEYAGAHSGQISLPGGKSEGNETSSETALREAEEEVGVKRDLPTVVGVLSNFLVIPSNFMITPVIATVSSVPTFKADPYEVAGIISGSIASLLDATAIHREEIFAGQYKMMAPHFKIDGAIVWGATAMMLNELRVVLEDFD